MNDFEPITPHNKAVYEKWLDGDVTWTEGTDADKYEMTDCLVSGLTVAVRERSHECATYYNHDFTIRETELDRIINGYGDLYLYTQLDQHGEPTNGKIGHLAVMRDRLADLCFGRRLRQSGMSGAMFYTLRYNELPAYTWTTI